MNLFDLIASNLASFVIAVNELIESEFISNEFLFKSFLLKTPRLLEFSTLESVSLRLAVPSSPLSPSFSVMLMVLRQPLIH